jgi:glycosyltransferase involved in cell wall biosynthesis
MATYNGEEYVEEQLESILSQLSATDEVIISDDNSTDETLSIIKKINDSRIKVFINEKESGYTKNFENALEKANGEIIFLSDQDDIWMEDKVSKIVSRLEECSFVVSDNTIVDKDLKVINHSHFDIYKTSNGFIRNLLIPRYVGACMAFRKEVLIKSLPFPENQTYTAHDYWISLISELYFEACMIHEPLIKYRRHGKNTSNGGFKSKNSLTHKLKVRFYTLAHLLKRYFR